MTKRRYTPRNPNECKTASRKGSIVCRCGRGYAAVIDGQCVKCRGFYLGRCDFRLVVLKAMMDKPKDRLWPTLDYPKLLAEAQAEETERRKALYGS